MMLAELVTMGIVVELSMCPSRKKVCSDVFCRDIVIFIVVSNFCWRVLLGIFRNGWALSALKRCDVCEVGGLGQAHSKLAIYLPWNANRHYLTHQTHPE